MDPREHANSTYAIHGEDLAIVRVLERAHLYRDDGFYVDVGCFHPFWASNTALLHARGWRGINVDPNPQMAASMAAARPEDVTLQCAVGATRGRADLHYFYEWASSNTLVPEFAAWIARTQDVTVAERIPVDVLPLADVLAEHATRPIDLLSVDVEGMDLEVLRSNDWSRFRPSVVAVEDLALPMATPSRSPIFREMVRQGYVLVSHVVLTSLYLDGRAAPSLVGDAPTGGRPDTVDRMRRWLGHLRPRTGRAGADAT